ncbi:hypothetical protein B7463_g6850, partial [Scytalidium lignicola]
MPERAARGDEQGSVSTERTPLLSPDYENASQHRYNISEEVIDDNELQEEEIEPNEFDLMLSKSTSFTSGLGVEAESQETAMLRGPRTYTHLGVSRRSSQATLRRRSNASSMMPPQDAIIEEVYEDDERKSPFLQGVSVGRFWLIFGSNSASWLSTAFLLTSTSFQPLCGRLSDTLGRKPPYIITTAIFLGATIWCALAQSMTSFILARALCGLGAGGMMAIGSIITSDLVPIEIRGAYQSYLNIVYGVGSTLGAATGGAIADHLGWRWEFGIQVPALVICLCIAITCIPNDLGLAKGVKKNTLWQAMQTFDFRGSILLTTSLTFLILGINLGGNVFDWSHPFVITSLAIFAVGFPLFLWVETRVLLPIMPLRLILNNPRAGLIVANSIGAAVANAVTFNIPLYFQAVLLESATSSGLKLIVPALASSFVGAGTGFIITYTRNLKMPLIWGAVSMVIGTISLCFMKRGLPDWSYLLFLVSSSIGQGFMFPATFMSVLAVSEQAEQAVVTSTLILWRSLGMVMGVSLSSLVVQNALRIYLYQYVTGPDKLKVIEAVRSSVQAIAKLEPVYREQAIESYVSALRANFIMAAIFAMAALAITIPLKLPLLASALRLRVPSPLSTSVPRPQSTQLHSSTTRTDPNSSDSALVDAVLKISEMSSAAEKANLARIRDNQRRSRARRKEYLQELEARLRQCELQGIEASAEIQTAARKVADENKKLRRLLVQHGIGEDIIESYIQQNAMSDGASGDQYGGASTQNLEYLLQARKPCCSEWGTNPSTQPYMAGDSERHGSSSSASTARSMWKPIPNQPLNRLQHSASIAMPGRVIGHQFMTPSSTTSGKSSISPGYPTSSVPYQHQLVPDSAQRSLSPASNQSRESSQIYNFTNQLPISHSSSFDNSHSDLQQLQISPSHTLDSASTTALTSTNVNSCIFASDMISTMTGSDPQTVRAEFGCGLGTDCQVDNQIVFDVMDRYSGPSMGI